MQISQEWMDGIRARQKVARKQAQKAINVQRKKLEAWVSGQISAAPPHGKMEEDDKLSAHIARRVPPSARSHYRDIKRLTALVCLDIERFADLLRDYMCIAEYRATRRSPRDVRMALLNHSFKLRGYELYAMLEAGSDTLRFVADVARVSGYAPEDRSKQFDAKLREKFKHDLRQRHKIVHRHERPSLSTRVQEAAAAASNREEAESLVRYAFEMTKGLLQAHAVSDEQFARAIERRLDLASDANVIWDLFSEEFRLTFPKTA